jgi:adenine-specific DNA methylase
MSKTVNFHFAWTRKIVVVSRAVVATAEKHEFVPHLQPSPKMLESFQIGLGSLNAARS